MEYPKRQVIWGDAVQVRFGDCALDTERRELRRGTTLVAIGPQVFDILVYLVENRERVVTKDDLLDAVWAKRIVSESTLTTHINAVRKAIGDSGNEQTLIRTIPRKGFRFVGDVRDEEGATARDAAHPEPLGGRDAVTKLLALPDRPSVAVLPFQNLSGDPDQEYFADGVVEDIIAALSRMRWLFVIARNSSFTYKGRAVDMKQAGRELGVRYVLEGSLRKAGNRVRITGQLIEAETGRHVWAERYDRSLDDIFALQDEITLNVVGAIEPSLRQAEIERVKRERPDNLGAYDLLLRALPDIAMAMPEEAGKALQLLDRALAIEPDYALAHGYAAWCHEIRFVRGGQKSENRDGAIRHAQKAIAHGPDDAEALALAGFALANIAHDMPAARKAFEQALAVSPSCFLALGLGAAAVGWRADAERAIEWGELGMRISPFDRLLYAPAHGVALGNFLLGHNDKAIEAAQRAVQSKPDFSISHVLLTAALAQAGRLPEAKEAAKRILALQPGFSTHGLCAALAVPPSLATPLSDALSAADVPQ